MSKELLDWIAQEKKKRGWRSAEVARRMSKSQATLSRTLNGKTKLSWSFCVDLAQVFEVPLEMVLRLGGLLPPLSAAAANGEQEEMLVIMRQLSVERRELIMDILRGLVKPYPQSESEVGPISAEEKRVLQAFRSLLPNDRETITKMLDALARGQGEKDNSE